MSIFISDTEPTIIEIIKDTFYFKTFPIPNNLGTYQLHFRFGKLTSYDQQFIFFCNGIDKQFLKPFLKARQNLEKIEGFEAIIQSLKECSSKFSNI